MAKKLKKLRVTLVKSAAAKKPKQRKTLDALGLRKISQSVEKEATPAILGMIKVVSHLVSVEEIS
jgi:large subunit ribosomal protein L30